MKRTKTCAVYAIEHVPTGRCYIGGSVGFERRRAYHVNRLRRGLHENGPLQEAWAADGECAFSFRILEVLADAGELRTREQIHLDAHRAKCGVFNLYSDVNSPRGFKRSAASIRATAEKNRGRKRSPETRRKMSRRMKGNKNGSGHSYCGHLREEDVLPIFQHVIDGVLPVDIAARFRASDTGIRRIISRKTWAKVEVPIGLVVAAQKCIATNRARGVRRAAPKLTEHDVETIRHRLTQGDTCAKIASDYGVTPPLISAIRYRRIWK